MKGRAEGADWKGRYNPAGEPALREALRDPSNPVRRALDILLESAKEMVRDGRMKIVDGVPVFRDDVKKMLAEREARRHSRCSKDDPCGGVFNSRLKASPAAAPDGGVIPAFERRLSPPTVTNPVVQPAPPAGKSAMRCTVCDAALRLLHADHAGWMAACSAPGCAALHRGDFAAPSL